MDQMEFFRWQSLIYRPRAADFNNEMGRVVNQCGSQKTGTVGKVVLHRISRGVALSCLVLLVILPIGLGVVREVHPKTDTIRIALFWTWMFISPLLAGMGLLLAMLAMVIVNPRFRGLAALLAFLTTAFLLLISQMI